MTNRSDIAAALPAILEEIREVNAKWHVNPDGTPKPHDETFNNRCVLLMKSELMEAFEGIRKGNQPDDHLPQYPTESVEMLDLFIRSIDNLVFSGEDEAIQALINNIGDDHGTKYVADLNDIDFYTVLDMTYTGAYGDIVSILAGIDLVIAYCDLKNIPMLEIYRAKTDYNKSRADHKLENRVKVGGKLF